MMRWEVIQKFIDKYKYESYCEIGIHHSWNWINVNCKEKVAVDPNKSIPIPQGGEFFNITSDEFFAQLEPDKKFQIFFVDGLHEHNQVLRDIQNCIKHLGEGGVIIAHDMNPPTYKHTTTGDEHGNWNGDCYKAMIRCINNPRINGYTIDTDWGIGVIRPLKMGPNGSSSIDKYLNDWDLFDANRKDLLNLISVEEFLELEK